MSNALRTLEVRLIIVAVHRVRAEQDGVDDIGTEAFCARLLVERCDAVDVFGAVSKAYAIVPRKVGADFGRRDDRRDMAPAIGSTNRNRNSLTRLPPH